MEGAVGRIQAVYQSMLKEYEVSTNGARGWDYRENRKKECQFCGNTDPLNLPKGLGLNSEGGECWYCLAYWMGKGKACSVVIATPEEEQPFPKRTEALAHYNIH